MELERGKLSLLPAALFFSFSVGRNIAQVPRGGLMAIFSPKLTQKTQFTVYRSSAFLELCSWALRHV